MVIWRRLASLFSWLSWLPWYRREERDAELERELRDHLELEAEDRKKPPTLRTEHWATR